MIRKNDTENRYTIYSTVESTIFYNLSPIYSWNCTKMYILMETSKLSQNIQPNNNIFNNHTEYPIDMKQLQ